MQKIKNEKKTITRTEIEEITKMYTEVAKNLNRLGKNAVEISSYIKSEINIINDFLTLDEPFNNAIPGMTYKRSFLDFSIEKLTVYAADLYLYDKNGTTTIFINSPIKKSEINAGFLNLKPLDIIKQGVCDILKTFLYFLEGNKTAPVFIPAEKSRFNK